MWWVIIKTVIPIPNENLLLLEHLPEACFAIEASGKVVVWNPFLEKLVKISPNQVIGKANYEYSKLLYGKTRPSLIDIFFMSKAQIQSNFPFISTMGQTYEVEEYNSFLKRHFLIKATPIYDSLKNIVGAYQIFTDISDRIKAEELLAEDEYKYSTLFHQSNDSIFITDPNQDYKILDSNQKANDLFGYTSEEFQKISFLNLVSMGWPAKIIDAPFFECNLLKKDKTQFIGEIFVNEIQFESRKITQISIRDITERKKMEKIISAEKERLAVTLRSLGEGVIATDNTGKINLLNRIAEQILESSQNELLGKNISEILNFQDTNTGNSFKLTIDKSLFSPPLHPSKSNQIKYLITKNGKKNLLEYNLNPILDSNSIFIGAVVIFQDITEKRRFEEELFKAQKMESIGVLAGGIAHDFNNILTLILGNLSFAKLELDPHSEVAKIINDAEVATSQATQLTKQLLTFSKGGKPIKKIVMIKDNIMENARFALRGSPIALSLDIAEDLWPINADEGQISQVINNIVINAVQAMPKEGKIIILAENVAQPQTIKTFILDPSQNYIHIAIVDQGVGIPKENLSKIFDPYFTTKSKGTGLGLAVCYSIIKNHDGYINIDSTVGVGTTVHIFLPAIVSSAVSPTNITLVEPVHMKFQGKSVIIMDDDLGIRQLLGKMLEWFGFIVSYAQDGTELIEKYRSALIKKNKFSFIVMDLTIPGGMGGKDAIKRILELDRNAIAVVSSGYSNDLIIANYKDYGFAGVLIKPYRTEDLFVLLNTLNL